MIRCPHGCIDFTCPICYPKKTKEWIGDHWKDNPKELDALLLDIHEYLDLFQKSIYLKIRDKTQRLSVNKEGYFELTEGEQ